MGDYQRTGPNGMVCNIGDAVAAAYIALGLAHESVRRAIEIPADERQTAAQALAGDEWRVVPAKQPGPEDRPEPVDPATVRVGDTVEVQRHTDDEPWWQIAGTVEDIRFGGRSLFIAGNWWNADTVYSAVYMLRRAEPEPDPGQVQALEQILGEIQRMDLKPTTDAVPRELVRRKSDVAKALGLSDGGPHGE